MQIFRIQFLHRNKTKEKIQNTETEVVAHERIPFALLSRELALKTSSYCDAITRTSLFPLWLYEWMREMWVLWKKKKTTWFWAGESSSKQFH